MSTRKDMDRRRFMTQAGRGAALGLGAMAATSAQSRSVKKPVDAADPRLPRTGRLLKESEAIGIGIVGVGGMGGSHFEDLTKRERDGQPVQLRGISDVYTHRLDYRQKWYKKNNERGLETYMDYRELLERDDIHGVIIATPDHWHAQVAIDAMEAGKDVYCQKPVTLTIEESLDVRDTVLATGRVFQCGAQGSSDDWWWQARKFIKQGGIGKVLWAQADSSRNSAGGPNDRGGEWNWHIHPKASDKRSAKGHYIDWERWLGPAPKRPFSPPRFFQFRKYWDYSGGIATDLHYHVLAPMTIALDAQAPERATGSGGIFVQHDDREVPDTFLAQLDYPGDFTIVLTGSMANRQGNPVMIRGHRATIRPEGGGIKVTAENEFKEWFKKEYGAEEIVIPSEPRPGHMDNWLECMRTRAKCHLDAETAYRAMAGIKMGVDSYRQDKVIFWDGKRERYARRHPRPHRDAKEPRNPA